MNKIIICFLSLVLFSCANKSTKKLNVNSAAISSDFKLRSYSEGKWENDLQYVAVPDKSIPYLNIQMLIKTGAAQNPIARSGLSGILAAMMDKGTKNKSAKQIAESLALIGADFSAYSDYDYTVFNISGLPEYQDEILNLFSEIILQVSFDEKELDIIRKNVLANIKSKADDPSDFVEQVYEQKLFENSNYGNPLLGRAIDVKSLSKKELMQFYLKYYRPNNAAISVSGMYEADYLNKVKNAFASWEKQELPSSTSANTLIDKNQEILLVDKEDLTQSQIRFGHLGIPRNHPDFLKLRLANTILGRGFSSHLVDEIRDNRGLTYSISSDFSSLKDTGSFTVSSFSRLEKTSELISTSLDIVKRYQKNGMTEQELERAKAIVLGAFPQAVETPQNLARNLLLLRMYGIDDNYLKNFVRDLNSIELDQVNKAIAEHIRPEKIQIVVYSKAQAVEADLKKIAILKKKSFKQY